MPLPGLRFRPVYFVPTFSKHQGEVCAGTHLFVTDRERFQPLSAMLPVLQILKRRYPDEFAWRQAWAAGAHRPIDLLWGSDAFRLHIDADKPVGSLIESWQPELREFERTRADYLLYP